MSTHWLPQYTLNDVISQSTLSIARGRRNSDNAPVVIKFADSSTANEHARLAYEYSILQVLAGRTDARVVKPVELVQSAGHTALVLHDVAGTDIVTLMRQGLLRLQDVLHIGREIALALGQVHQARIIHKDVTPHNIVFDRDTGAVQLIDFGISTRLLRDWQHGESLRALEGTLPYVSPEQTGRVNRAIDYRTDFYSLGATLYEMLAHRPPFLGMRDDLLELVHAIISRTPTPLEEVARETPPMVAAVIRKMMAKSVEDRYQSAHGIAQDLQRCLGEGAAFTLAQDDRCERFEPPQKLYGRETQRRTLLDEFAQSTVGLRRMVLVSGSSGVGKSSLVNELQPAVVGSKGRFVAGKFDQMRRHVPLDAFSAAIHRFVKQVLTEDTAVVERWKQVLNGHLGGLGQALVDIVPGLALLIGQQRPLTPLPPQETENRLLAALRSLVMALCHEHPLVLFLDDLQWADSTTFQLLESLLADEQACAGLLVIGSYRTVEDDTYGSTLEPLLRLAGKVGAKSLALEPLSLNDVRALVADTVHSRDAQALADLVHAKTAGNAFFVGEFLKHLWSQELIVFDVQAGSWRWDLSAIQTLQATDNVAAFMSGQLRNLAPDTQGLLGFAACLADVVGLDELARLTGRPQSDLGAALWPVVDSGFLIPLDVSHRYVGNSEATGGGRLRFAHDRVRQACYELLTPDQAARYHYQIAESLMAKHAGEPTGEALFAVLHHCSRSQTLLVDPAARARVGALYLKAAREAKRSAAYGAARDNLERAMELVDALSGDARQRFLHQCELELADCEYLTGLYEPANERLARLLAGTQDPLEKARFHSRRVHVLYGSGDPKAAIETAVEGLGLLGVRIDAHPSLLSLGRLLLTVRHRLRQLPNVQSIEQLPELTDARATVLTELFASLFHSAQVSGNDELFALASWHLLLLTLDFGLSQATAFACATSALTVMAALGDVSLGKGLSEVATHLITARGTMWIASARLAISTVASHLTYTPEQLAEFDVQSCQLGTAAGDFGGIALTSVFGAAIHMSVSLARWNDFRDARKPLIKNHPESMLCMTIVGQAVKCLRGETAGPAQFSDERIQEEDLRKQLTPVAGATFNSMKLQCAIIQRDFPTALASIALQSRDPLFGQHAYVSLGAIRGFFFAIGLTQEALHNKRRRVQMPRLLRWARRRMAWFVKNGGAPVYSGAACLIEAEIAALRGDVGAAVRLYEQALPQLEASGYKYYAAIAYECAARYCLSQNLTTSGVRYVQCACDLYETWGATDKVAKLTHEFDVLLVEQPVPRSMRSTVVAGKSRVRTASIQPEGKTQREGAALDWLALLNAAQAMSSEVQVSKVVDRLLEVLLSTAGADYGALYLREHGELVLQAHRGNVAAANIVGETAAALRLLAYVERTGELVILSEGDRNPMWADPHLKARQPKSVLCAAVTHKGELRGVLYLENRSLSQAFTPQRIGVVNLIAGQTAISLENASLYADLESRVNERTVALREAQAQVLHLEKSNIEMQMAGGFAHEMRNALFAASVLLSKAIEGRPPKDENLYDATGSELATCLRLAQEHLPAAKFQEFAASFTTIVAYQDELKELICDAKESTERALRTTKQILEYAKLGKVVKTQHLRSSSAEVIERSLRELSVALQEASVTVERRIDGPGHVFVPEDHLHSIVSNLVGNAKDALAGEATKVAKLTVGVTQVQGRVRIEFADNGPGIADYVRDKLFQPFVSTKGAAGTGLGLAMTRKLVELYGGTIEVQTELGRGTKFTVVLPTGGDTP